MKISYHHGQNRLDVRKINLIYCQLLSTHLISDLGTGKQEDEQPKHFEKSPFLSLSQAQLGSFTPYPLPSSLPPCYHHRLPMISPSSEEWGYGQDLAVPLCCSLLVVLPCSNASLPQAAVNIAFPNHQLMQDSVL